MRHSMQVLVAGALAASLAAASADEELVRGKKVAQRTALVAQEIGWRGSLAEARRAAQRERKLVFWLQLVGSLEGGL